ncbi:alpha/beta hydrolase [Pseudonocardia lacus]|uniref:alpha/beta hydrolase n=1 Tax=Pseudonocardia lacus TaxID=2835865 RepID=UPI001BDCAC05|nr:alpha/beta hydrolase [Pseudonocardia lacus]
MTYAFDPELAAVIPLLPAVAIDDLPAARAGFAAMIAEQPEPDTTGVHVEDRSAPGRDGAPEVPLRVYRPERVSAPAAIYDVHGGGFVLGDLSTDHARNVQLARELGVVVVSVDYRLAPETPFPGPLEDVHAGLAWTAEHAEELGVDPRRIAVRGTSAGGGLAAGLALLARDRGGPHIAFQFLAIPELDDRLTTPSMTAFTDTPIWSRPRAVISWNAYLGEGVPGTDGVSPYAAPARATDLAGLPPTYISVMHFDPLRDEGIAYAQALLAAGVTVELHLFPGTFHGSGLVEHAAITQRGILEEATVLRTALGL